MDGHVVVIDVDVALYGCDTWTVQMLTWTVWMMMWHCTVVDVACTNDDMDMTMVVRSMVDVEMYDADE
jgi:hypothetical protein